MCILGGLNNFVMSIQDFSFQQRKRKTITPKGFNLTWNYSLKTTKIIHHFLLLRLSVMWQCGLTQFGSHFSSRNLSNLNASRQRADHGGIIFKKHDIYYNANVNEFVNNPKIWEKITSLGFSCAEPNANELEQRILLIYIRFGAWEERRLKWA